ncbi:MAG TPA: alpha/beta hydrolase [Pseudonocardia sp.]|nr:alpha/beta hydrolase [Pseudonocardia sp.]
MTDRAEGRVVGAGDVELYWQAWLPPSPRGVLLLCHGLGEHAGRYGNVVEAVVPDGWAVYGLDQRGHGLSGGRRAHIERYADLLTDVDVFRRTVVDRHPDLPVVLLGHSMGGQIALAYALDHQDDLAGLVLSAPALAGDVVPKPVVPLLRALGRVAPRLRLAGIDVTKISKDPAVVAAYQADRLVHHGKPTLALGLSIVGQFAVLPERARDLTLPLLLQHGSVDALTDPVGTRLLAATAGSADKTVLWYDGLWHEIYNEPERARPLADLRAWLRRTFP